MPVPQLFARLAVHRRADARRRLAAFCDGFAAARGSPESVQQAHRALSQAAGDLPADGGGIDGLVRALGGG